MKKILLLALVCSSLFSSNSYAQLPDGSLAPNFTVTDINGTQHNLYSYLGQGYTVVIDVSATWCGPCWGYHQSGALEDLYVDHGPAGYPGVSANTTDDVMVLWVEGDPSTTQADLQGTGANTQGNWLANTAFPIIDNASLANLYETPYYPIVYTVCPNGIIRESGQLSAAAHYNGLSTCETPTAGKNVSIMNYTGETISCGQPAAMSVNIQNMSTENLTACTINVLDGGTNVLSYNWSGNLGTYNIEDVFIGTVTPTASTNYVVELLVENNASNNYTTTAEIIRAEETEETITVELLTDTYADEIWMEITTSWGDILWSEGNENVQGDYGTGQFPPAADPTSPLANSTSYTWTVPLIYVDCYTFTIYDYYGDGLQEGAQGSWSIKNNTGNIILSESAANYGAMDAGLFKNSIASLDEMTAQNIVVYPNPAKDVVNVSFENTSETAVSIMDLQGRVLSTQLVSGSNGTQLVSISTGDFAQGTYVVSVRANGLTSNTNVVIN